MSICKRLTDNIFISGNILAYDKEGCAGSMFTQNVQDPGGASRIAQNIGISFTPDRSVVKGQIDYFFGCALPAEPQTDRTMQMITSADIGNYNAKSLEINAMTPSGLTSSTYRVIGPEPLVERRSAMMTGSIDPKAPYSETRLLQRTVS